MAKAKMKFTGGIRYGRNYCLAFNATWPFAQLLVEPDFITLTSRFLFWRSELRFEKNQIKRISEYRPLISMGLRIEHSVAGYPPFILFWTFIFDAIKAELVQNGYSVA